MKANIKNNVMLFNVIDNGKVVFKGSASEIHDRYGIITRNVYDYAYKGKKLQRKYSIKLAGIYRKHYQIKSVVTGETFTGMFEEILNKLVISEKTLWGALWAKDRKLLGEWEIKEV